MNPFRFLRFLLTLLAFRIDDADGGGATDPAPAAPVVDAPAADAPTEQAAPASMLEAMEQALQPRDEMGRFAPKNADGTDAAPAVPAAQAAPAAAAAPAEPAKPAAPDDILAMPEGLQPKAQERFQALANATRELREQVAQRDEALSGIRETFQANGITREQFEQATGFIGAVNRGDLASAEKVLLGQLQQLSLLTGKNYGQAVDPLAEFGDLRQAVDGLQITEQHAIEIARARKHQVATQQAQARQQAEAQTQQAQQAELQRGTQAVDAFCKQMQASDLDYQRIEAELLPVLPGMLKDIPPAQWVPIVKAQYQLIKQVAGRARQAPAGGLQQPGTVLRPTGSGSPAAAPKSMMEAMFPGG